MQSTRWQLLLVQIKSLILFYPIFHIFSLARQMFFCCCSSCSCCRWNVIEIFLVQHGNYRTVNGFSWSLAFASSWLNSTYFHTSHLVLASMQISQPTIRLSLMALLMCHISLTAHYHGSYRVFIETMSNYLAIVRDLLELLPFTLAPANRLTTSLPLNMANGQRPSQHSCQHTANDRATRTSEGINEIMSNGFNCLQVVPHVNSNRSELAICVGRARANASFDLLA